MLDALYIIYTIHICIPLSQDRIGLLMLDTLYIVHIKYICNPHSQVHKMRL